MRPVLALLLIVACGGDEPLPDAAVGDGIELAPYAGWPADVAVRRVGDTLRTTPTQLELDGRGGVWLLRDEKSDDAQLFGAPLLERHAASGQRVRRVTFDAGALVPGFVVHPSGELTVFVLQPIEGQRLYRLELLRLSTDGEILARRDFQDTPGPRETLYYDDSGVHELPVEGPLRFGDRAHVVGLPDGEGLYLYAWSYGAKLYRLDAAGAELWDAQVMPANLGMAFMFIDERLAVDERGRVHVAYQIFDEDVAVYNQHFGRAPLAAAGSYDVLALRYEPDGAFSAAQVFGGPGGDAPTGMSARGGRPLIAGASRIVKHDLPNRTREWDLFVLHADLDDPTRATYRTLDLARDDFGWALAEAADGTILLGGRTDYVQVDTNSEVEDGKGLLLALSPDLARRRPVTLVGPRDVQVQALRLAPDGRLWFAGIRDGYLTHTEPAERHNQGVLGATRLGL